MSRFLTKILNDKPGEKPKLEVVQKFNPDSQLFDPVKDAPTPIPILTPTNVSPERNFTKVANSIKPEIFRGTSQKTYMALYNLTRGAIVPKRTVKITRNDLMAYADVSEVTLVKHVTYLEKVAGLIKKTAIKGDNDGATYEVFMPEEIELPPPTPTPTPTSTKKLYGGTIKKLCVGGGGNLIENKDTYEIPKTLLKTNTNDDDDARANAAFSVMAKKLDAAAKKLTGKPSSKSDVEKWGTLAELLILEMEIAASRVDTISSAPAFLTEVLRRKLLNVNLSNSARTAKTDAVGKPNAAGEYEKKPLDEKGREAALLELGDFIGDEFLEDFKKWYTEEDWTWLMKKLSITRRVEK